MVLYDEYTKKVNDALDGLRSKMFDHMIENHLTIQTLSKACPISWTTLHKFLKLRKPIDMHTMKKMTEYLEGHSKSE